MFPGRESDGPLVRNDFYQLWRTARDAARVVANARLYALRHARVSHAVISRDIQLATGRLLRHLRVITASRYAHLDGATSSQASERVVA